MRRAPVPHTGPRRIVLPLPAGCSAQITVTDGQAQIAVIAPSGAVTWHRLPWTAERVRASGDSQLQVIADLATQRGLPPLPPAPASTTGGGAVEPGASSSAVVRTECGCDGAAHCRRCGGSGFVRHCSICGEPLPGNSCRGCIGAEQSARA